MARSKRGTEESPDVETKPEKASEAGSGPLPSNPQDAAVAVEEKKQAENARTSDATELEQVASLEPTPETKQAAEEEQRLADEGEEQGGQPDLPRTPADELADVRPTVAVDMPAETSNPQQELLAQQAPHRNAPEPPKDTGINWERDPSEPPSATLDADPGKRAEGKEVDRADGPTSSDDRQAREQGMEVSDPEPQPEQAPAADPEPQPDPGPPVADDLAYEKVGEEIALALVGRVEAGGKDYAWARAILVYAQRVLPRRWTDHMDARNAEAARSA